MFRRLAACMTENVDGFAADIGPGINQANYLDSQSAFYGRDIIPTTAPVSQSISQALGTVNPITRNIETPSVRFVNVDSNPTEKEERTCQVSTIDQLLTTQDPSSRLRCGWVYSSPSAGQPTPRLSQGALGTINGPTRPPNNGVYEKWFWNLEDAKKQILIDRCKALKDCKDVGSPRFAGCGFCPTLGQGIPVDSTGRPLYPDSQLTSCGKPVITRGGECPTAPPPVTGGTTDLCVPIGGRMPYGCLQSIITKNGCSPEGAMVVALSDSSRTGTDYVSELGKLQSMDIYNKVSEVPLNLDTFRQGTEAGLVAMATEIKGLANTATSKPSNSKLGAAARDLCVRKGAMSEFDFCSELVDTTPPPFSAECLAKEFLKAGGQLTGTKFPWPGKKEAIYDVLPNWKAVKDYIQGLVAKAKGVEGFQDMYSKTRANYTQQAQALMELRGIVPEQLSNRAPLSQGVEVYWFNNTTSVLLNNTIEGYFPTFVRARTPIPQTRGLPDKAMFVALTDVRARQNSQLQFQISSDDGFNISLNRNINGVANVDEPGYFGKNFIQGTTTYVNNACWNLDITRPNVIHAYWNDVGGGEHTFNLLARLGCRSGPFGQLQGLALTRELGGPFLMFEGTSGIYAGGWGDLRMTDFFNFDGWGNKSASIQIFSDTDSKLRAPGKNGFIRIKPSGYLALNNVSPAAWTTMTFVFRLNEKPTRNALFELGTYNPGGWMRYLKIYMTNVGSTAQIRYSHNINDRDNRDIIANGCVLESGKWYMGYVLQNGGPSMSTQWTVGFIPLESAKNNGNSGEMKFVVSRPSGPINAIANPTGYIRMGAADPGFVSGIGAPVNTVEYDIAWWHMFNRALGADDFKREAANDWLITPTFG
jgi:hypothetical protein